MPYADRDNPPGVYAAFATSTELRQAGETLVWNVEQGDWRQHDALIEVVTRFDEESSRAFVLDAIVAMGISGNAEHFVRATVSTLSTTLTRLARQILPRLERPQMQVAAAHVRSLSFTLPQADGSFLPMAGYPVPASVEVLRVKTSAAIRAGGWQAEKAAVSELLSTFGDLMIEEIYLKTVQSMGFGFLTGKLIQGGAGVGRALQHQLVRWAVDTLGEAEFLQMVVFMERLHLELKAPLPHRFLFHPND